MEPQLNYIKHRDINTEKWNNCIENAPNCRIYAYDWHLDRVADYWDALVWGDYEYVMPLPVRKKLGISYIFQPLFTQQLGIFPSPPAHILQAFIQTVQKKFSLVHTQLNSEIKADFQPSISRLSERNNYLLPLQQNIEQIQSEYSKNTKRNIAKAQKQNLTLVQGIRLEAYLEFKRQNPPMKMSEQDFKTLNSLIAFGQYKGFGEIWGVYTNDNQLCASAYICIWHNRIIFFNAASNEESKTLGAMYFLVNKVIETYAGHNLFLDFEGSMIPGVARFYAGFGAGTEKYFELKHNRLPLPLKWLKR